MSNNNHRTPSVFLNDQIELDDPTSFSRTNNNYVDDDDEDTYTTTATTTTATTQAQYIRDDPTTSLFPSLTSSFTNNSNNEQQQQQQQLPFQTKHVLCNDFFFLFLFLCFLLVMSIIYGSSRWSTTTTIKNNNNHRTIQPKTLLYPTDFLGRSCGAQNRQIHQKQKSSWFFSRRSDDDEKLKTIFPSVNVLSVPYAKSCQRAVSSAECQSEVWSLFRSLTSSSSSSSSSSVEQKNDDDDFYDMTQRPYLYFLDAKDPTTYGGICVSHCPGMNNNKNNKKKKKKNNQITKKNDKSDENVGNDDDYCPPELESIMVNRTVANSGQMVVAGCKFKRPDGKVFMNQVVNADDSKVTGDDVKKLEYRVVMNRCIPTSQSITASHFVPSTSALLSKYGAMLPPVISESVAHVIRQWKLIVLSMVASLCLSFGFMLLVRLFAKFFIWFVVSTVYLMLLAACSLSLMEALQWRQKYLPATTTFTFNKTAAGGSASSDAVFYYYSSMLSSQAYGLIALALGLILVIYSWFLYSHLKTVNRAVGIMREAARAVSSVPQLMLFSVGMFCLLTIFYLYWFMMSINLWSLGSTLVEKENTTFVYSKIMRYSSMLHLFAFFWISQFIAAFTTTTASNVISRWYFTPKNQRGVMFLTMPIVRAAITVLFYNLGSVAFGSLIVGTVQFLSFVLRRFVSRVEKTMRNKPVVGRIVSILAWIIRFLISVFNWLVSTITKHAYIQVAIYGTSFLTSSRKALKLITKHTAQILVLDWIVDWVLFCAKIFVSLITCYLTYWLSLVIPSSSGKVEPTDTFSLLLLSCIFFTSFRIASLFFNVYETATDTIIQCYMIDEELSKAEPSRRMYCSTELLGLMEVEKQENEEVIRMNGE